MTGTWSATATASVAIAADEHRASYTIQHYAGDAVYLGFGSPPTKNQGLRLSELLPVLEVDDHRARLSLYVVCDTGETANGGYETA